MARSLEQARRRSGSLKAIVAYETVLRRFIDEGFINQVIAEAELADHELRWVALRALEDQPASGELTSLFLKLSMDDDISVRFAAITALVSREVRRPDELATLVRATGDGYEPIRSTAADGLVDFVADAVKALVANEQAAIRAKKPYVAGHYRRALVRIRDAASGSNAGTYTPRR